MNPIATACMATSLGMPKNEQAIGMRSSEPPATPEAPQAPSVAMTLRNRAEANQEFMGTPIQPLRQYLVSNARFRHIDEMARKLDALEKEVERLKSNL